MSSSVTIGVEQEYFLVDPQTGQLRCHRGPQDVALLREALGERYCQEFHACMVETRTPVARSVSQAIDMARMDRQDVLEATRQIGLLPYSAGTHPDGLWRLQNRSPADRYDELAQEIGISARRALYCGLHIHIGVENNEDRIRLVRRLVPYLPFIVALSGSSPFWQGERTGYRAFRSRVQGEFPRSGLPPALAAWDDYRKYLDLLESSELSDPSTKVWWDVRPSGKYPTVEIRVADAMPSMEELSSLIALMTCTAVHLARKDGLMASLDGMSHQQVEVNRWLTQRDGTSAMLIDNHLVRRPLREQLGDLLEALSGTADELDCRSELFGCMQIAERGSSAVRQLEVYDEALRAGHSHGQSLNAVRHAVLEEALFGQALEA